MTDAEANPSEPTPDGDAQPAGHDHDREVRAFFDGYARLMVQGDGPGVALRWEAPALVIGTDGVVAVTSLDAVAEFYASAKGAYAAQGIMDTRPEVLRLESAPGGIYLVDVRWPQLDADGQEVGEEGATYILRTAEDGQLRIRVMVVREETPVH